MKTPRLPSAIALAALALVPATVVPPRAAGQSARPAGSAATAWTPDTASGEGIAAGMTRRYAADYGSLDRFHSAPYSPVRAARFERFFQAWLAALDSLDHGALDRQDRADAILLRNTVEYELGQIAAGRTRFAEMSPLIPFAPALIALEEERRALSPVEPGSTAALLDSLRSAVLRTRAGLDSAARGGRSGIRPAVAYRAARAVGEIRKMLAGWFAYRDGYDPEFSWWVRAPYGSLDTLLGEYAAFLRERLAGVGADDRGAIVGDPIGRDALLEELRSAMIPYTPEELVAIAERELAWCEAEMRKAAAEMGYGADWRNALERVKTLHVAPGDQPALIADLAAEAVRFLEDRDLVTVPPLAKETWRMQMLSPEQQMVSPFFLGGEVIQVAFPTSGMPHEQKMMSLRGNNVHFARATVQHELIPGHHLQGFMNQRYRPYRRVFGTPFWTEGWALYWELLLWDLGFPRSPEDRMGMLFWRSHRCARIIFSLGFHLRTMTPEQCIALLVDRVGHERDNATAEVRRSFRGDYGPLYQCAYLLGGLQFRALRGEIVGGGRATDRDFHDAVLKNGPMPVAMLRLLLTGEEISAGGAVRWRFDDPPRPDR